MTSKVFLFLIVGVFLNVSYANTFIGNGGNSEGDIEFLVTKKQMRVGLKDILNNKEGRANCECLPVYSNHGECNFLKNLNREQKNFCINTIEQFAKKAYQVLQSEDVKIQWTHTKITVRENAKVMSVDAVANPEEQTITINKPDFLKMTPSQRVFLLAHEVFHFAKIENKYVGDTGSIGPFKGAQGQRAFLNALAASVVMKTYQEKAFYKYRKVLSRAQSHHLHWLDGDLALLKPLNSMGNSFAPNSYTNIGITYRYYALDSFGFNAGFYLERGSSSILNNSVSAKDRIQNYRVGLSYRYFPFSNPLSAWGQSFVNFDLTLEYIKSQFEIKDDYVGVASKDSGLGWGLYAKYYLPLNPVHLTFGFGINQRKYEHSQFNFNKNTLQLNTVIGVSYGF